MCGVEREANAFLAKSYQDETLIPMLHRLQRLYKELAGEHNPEKRRRLQKKIRHYEAVALELHNTIYALETYYLKEDAGREGICRD